MPDMDREGSATLGFKFLVSYNDTDDILWSYI